MVHRADAELAVGRDVVLDAGLAADGIDEWLASVTDPRYRQRGDGSRALPVGAVLRLQATGAGPSRRMADQQHCGGPAACSAALAVSTALLVSTVLGDADVSVSGPADRLLLVLVRRLPADDPAITVSGDAALLTGWLAGTPF